MSGFARVFLVPALISVLSIVGLVSALVGDGTWDAIAWAALAVPVATLGWAMLARRT